MAYCTAKGCKHNDSHNIRGHKCRKCENYGHGVIECGHDIVIQHLRLINIPKINNAAYQVVPIMLTILPKVINADHAANMVTVGKLAIYLAYVTIPTIIKKLLIVVVCVKGSAMINKVVYMHLLIK